MVKRAVLGLIGVMLWAPVAAQQKMDKVVASWLPIMQTMAYYVALEEKLFQKAGIEIDSKMLMRVDFPQPFGPKIEVIRPCGRSRSKLS